MTDATSAPPTIIRAMHARYEAAWEEYNAIDVEEMRLQIKSEEERALSLRYQEAKLMSAAETDALRDAILLQVPIDWLDAMILLHHIHTAHDMYESPTREERRAVTTALDTLFDFMACEIDQDHSAVGKQFAASCLLVWQRRRFRTGLLHDE